MASHTVNWRAPSLRSVVIHRHGQPAGRTGEYWPCMTSRAIQRAGDRRRNMIGDLGPSTAVLHALRRIRAVMAGIATRRGNQRVVHGRRRKGDDGSPVIFRMTAVA